MDWLRSRYVGWVAATPLVLLGCSSDLGRTEWEYGAGTDYVVSGTSAVSVPDPVSGGTFHFPQGGEGTLSVAPILSGPLALPEDGPAFGMGYVGTGAIELHLPRLAETASFLVVAGSPSYSTYEPVPEAGAWLPVPPDDPMSDPVVFRLGNGLEPLLAARSDMRMISAQSAKYYLSAAARSLSMVQQEYLDFVRLDQELEQTIASLIAKLPVHIKGAIGAAVQSGPMKRHASALGSDISSYVGFRRYWYSPTVRETYPYFNLVARGPTMATASTLAHEAGHYLSHLLLGDESFDLLEAQLRAEHDFGDVVDARPMLEEYAQFADQLENGHVRLTSGWNLAEPIAVLRSVSGAGPAHRNWPGIEGYGAALMTALMRTSGTLAQGLSGDPEDMPAFGLSAADIFGMLAAHKPLTVDQLRASVGILMAGLGRDDALPAFLERTGWSYHGTGKVVDANNKPIAGAEVVSVCRVASEGGREYLAPLAPVKTDGAGVFKLERLFPTDTQLRVSIAGVTRDFPRYVDPLEPTTNDLDLGTIVFAETEKFSELTVQIIAKRDWRAIVGTSDTRPGTGMVDNLGAGAVVVVHKLEASEAGFEADLSWSYPGEDTTAQLKMMACTFDSQGAIARCPVEYREEANGGTWRRNASFALAGLARTADGTDRLTFDCSGSQCQAHIQELIETFEEVNASGVVLAKYEVVPGSIHWDDPFDPARITLSFWK